MHQTEKPANTWIIFFKLLQEKRKSQHELHILFGINFQLKK